MQWDNFIMSTSEVWIFLRNTWRDYLERPENIELKLRSPEAIHMYSFLRLFRVSIDDLIRYLEISDLYTTGADCNVKNRRWKSLVSEYFSVLFIHRYEYYGENLEISISILM